MSDAAPEVCAVALEATAMFLVSVAVADEVVATTCAPRAARGTSRLARPVESAVALPAATMSLAMAALLEVCAVAEPAATMFLVSCAATADTDSVALAPTALSVLVRLARP